MRRWLLLLSLMVATPSTTASAALTAAQYRVHLRQLILNGVQAGLTNLIEMSVAYGRLGIDQREAAVTFLKEVYQAQTGINPMSSAIARHQFKHWVEDAASGEGFEP